MRTYDKRIGFLINSEHIKPTGGNGQFCKSFYELMDKNNIKVDIITDKAPHYKQFASLINTNIIYPDDPLKEDIHKITFGKPDSFCLEKMVNFRNAIMKAMTSNMYDVFVCNSPESIFTAISLGISENVQIIAYTHLESQIFEDTSNPFCKEANEIMRQNLTTENIFIGTQSSFNVKQFKRNNVYECPIPLTEPSLLKKYKNKREGILFVGRWEDGKNPKLFIELIRKTKLPAKVMTSPTGVKKFDQELKQLGVKYEIVHSLVGQEKVDFIVNSRIGFNPSLVESYGMAFHEQTIQIPTLALEGKRWLNNFNSSYFYTCNEKNMVDTVKELYNHFDEPSKWYNIEVIKYYKDLEDQVFDKWKKCFDAFIPKQVKNDSAAINKQTSVCYDTFIKSLQRTHVSLGNDLKAIYNNKHKFKVIYTDEDTYLTKDTMFVPIAKILEEKDEVKLQDPLMEFAEFE